ncbi:MAG: hypothetical protein Q9178_001124 [Gyalolechia marmorata]
MNVSHRNICWPVYKYVSRYSSANVGERPFQRYEDTRDIYIDDLDATLEAHRATNRAKIIRRVKAPPDPGNKTIVHGDSAVDRSASSTKLPSTTRRLVAPTSTITDNSISGPRGDNVAKVEPAATSQGVNGQTLEADRIRPPSGRFKIIIHVHLLLMENGVSNLRDTRARYSALGSNTRTGRKAMPYREIIAFEKYMAPSHEELKATRSVASEVQSLILSTLNDVSCAVIGSYSTGLALPFSDIDFAVSFPAVESEVAIHNKSPRGLQFQKIYRKGLYKIFGAFRSDANFTQPELVCARIPIARAIHRKTNQEIQVQIQTGGNAQQQHTLAYQAEYPSLRPLYVVLRSCLEMRGLSRPYEGGLGSYPILISIVNALKHASGQHDPHDLGSQLLHVLQFYESSDLCRYGFSADPPRLFRKDKRSMAAEERLRRAADPVLSGIDTMAKLNPLRPYLLCLQDPADPKNDLGRRAYAIKHIQETFAVSRRSMVEAMEVWNRQTNKPVTSVGLLDALVHANYGHLESERTRLGLFRAPRLHNRRTTSAREMLEKVMEVDRRKAAKDVSQNDQGSLPEPECDVSKSP